MLSTLGFIAVIILILGLLIKFDGTSKRSPYEKEYYKNFSDELKSERAKNLFL